VAIVSIMLTQSNVKGVVSGTSEHAQKCD